MDKLLKDLYTERKNNETSMIDDSILRMSF